MRTVVFVADDLGVSAGVNRGIARAADAGMVREASLCVLGAAVRDGVKCANDRGIGIGLHLSFTLGRALTGRIAGLTDAQGRFRGLLRTLLATALRRADRRAIEREIRAQVDALHDLGVAPTHMNGHHHVHVMPIVRDCVFPMVAAAGVKWTRLPREHAAAGGPRGLSTRVVAQLANGATAAVHAAGLRTLPFVGMSMEGRTDFARRAERTAPHLPDEPIEWMVHPREPDADLAALDPLGHARPSAAEAAFLTDRGTAPRLGLRPASYRDLEHHP